MEQRKAEFLRAHPESENVAAYWAKYQHVFSAEGLPDADPRDLKAFANSSVGARIGNMSVFNTAWNEMGDEAAATQARKVIDYLLRGEQPAALEDRLTELINGRPVEMKGLKEAILTKVLCVVYPEEYMRYLVYTGEHGKQGVTRTVWGLELPAPKETGLSIGQLIQRSNDLLVELVGAGFRDLQHASDFIWWWVSPRPDGLSGEVGERVTGRQGPGEGTALKAVEVRRPSGPEALS
ncbi:hypothetical protein [Sinomonas notoginsengisoli]|uniref:hypothetical protein n=1 Tax=Sinomonas notoginsengisoli TaxID=1457311 RepID=UPI001F2E9F25|nr:hypothetical protein [Sinomonas notoginsengisoli]